MPFPKIDSDLIDTGILQGQIPIIGAGNKLPNSIINSGAGANQLVQLDNAGKLPPLDASQLINLTGGGASAQAVATQVITSNVGQVDFTNIPSGFKHFALWFDKLTHNHNVTTDLSIRFFKNGVIQTGSQYTYHLRQSYGASAQNLYDSGGDTKINANMWWWSGYSNGWNNGIIEMFNFSQNGISPGIIFRHMGHGNDATYTDGAAAFTDVLGSTDKVDGLRIYPTNGLITAGALKLYGFN